MILNKQKSEELKEEAEADLFSDMAPTIRKLVFLWQSENSEKESLSKQLSLHQAEENIYWGPGRRRWGGEGQQVEGC